MTYPGMKPNSKIPLSQVRVGSVTDARWRVVPQHVKRIDSLDARPPMFRHDIKKKGA